MQNPRTKLWVDHLNHRLLAHNAGMWTCGRGQTVMASCINAVHEDVRQVDSWDTSCELRPTSNGSREVTYKTVDDAAHYFGVADEVVSMSHLRADLRLAP